MVALIVAVGIWPLAVHRLHLRRTDGEVRVVSGGGGSGGDGGGGRDGGLFSHDADATQLLCPVSSQGECTVSWELGQVVLFFFVFCFVLFVFLFVCLFVWVFFLNSNRGGGDKRAAMVVVVETWPACCAPSPTWGNVR